MPIAVSRATARGMLACASIAALSSSALAQSCPSGVVAMPKSSALYLFYPTAIDNTFPSYAGEPTSPLNPFNLADLDPAIGTAAQLRTRVEQLTEAGYCEFDVNVKTTTALPAPAEPRWQIVGIGTDDSGSGLIGIAQDVDANDSDPQDYARFWVESLQSWAGAELTGGNSTLERWATGLTNLVVHESGHNYGGTHGGGVAIAGEDATVNHFMTNPALGANPNSIVDALNHFSDTNYEILAHNIGLTAKTLTNWDFVNPNSSNANKLVITVLSNAPSLTIGWWYNGTLSPWQNPTVADTGTTATFRGTNYKKYEVTFSSAKAWSGGANGVAPPDVKFHVGASFTQPDPVIVYEATLFNGSTALALHPRIFDFDVSAEFSGFFASIVNPAPEEGFLILSDLRVLFSPRMIDIETMIGGAAPRAMNGLPAQLYARPKQQSRLAIQTGEELARRRFDIGEEPVKIPLAEYTDKRHYDVTYGPNDCPKGSIGSPGLQRRPLKRGLKPREPKPINPQPNGFGPPGSAEYCLKGNQVSLFPATFIYISATLTDPKAKHWDAKLGDFVEGPLSTQVFFQAAGVAPDANQNGVDDLLDIRTKTSRDGNRNGIPDEVERKRKATDRYPVLVREAVMEEKQRAQ